MKNRKDIINDMFNVIINKDNINSNIFVGEKTLLKEFEEKQYIPTTIKNLIEEKVNSDYETIEKALKLLEFYKSAGVDGFDNHLENISNHLIKR